MRTKAESDDNLCFFITRIGEEGSPEREQADGVLDAIVKPAAKELGMECVRADQLPDPGQITTQIIDRIVGAKMVVADLTGANPNVYYELAVRNSFRLPAALLAEEGETLPFDTSVMRTIFYAPDNMKSVAAARDELLAHMKRALEGAVDSPIATAVDLASLRAGSAQERQLADIVRGLETLSLENQEIRRVLTQAHAKSDALPAAIRVPVSETLALIRAERDREPSAFLDRIASLIETIHEYVEEASDDFTRARPLVESQRDRLRDIAKFAHNRGDYALARLTRDYLRRDSYDPVVREEIFERDRAHILAARANDRDAQ